MVRFDNFQKATGNRNPFNNNSSNSSSAQVASSNSPSLQAQNIPANEDSARKKTRFEPVAIVNNLNPDGHTSDNEVCFNFYLLFMVLIG